MLNHSLKNHNKNHNKMKSMYLFSPKIDNDILNKEKNEF